MSTGNSNPWQPTIASDDVKSMLSRKMRDISLAEKERLVEAQAIRRGIPYLNLTKISPTPESLRLVPESDARKIQVIPFSRTEHVVRLGAVDPSSENVKRIRTEIEQREKIQTEVYMISEHSLEASLPLYSMVPKLRPVVDTVTITPERLQEYEQMIQVPTDLAKHLENVPMTDMVTVILAGGIVASASDIHVEAEENDVKIRYRIDGVLQDAATIEKSLWKRLVTRIKEIARLKINVENIPQDGHIKIETPGETIEVRVSTLPTNWGESVVMRLLLERARNLTYDQLGLRGNAYRELEQEIRRPNGMIIVTGPTGSGKTTTLYAILHELNTPERKIITLENPIEYQIPGLNQTQINANQNFTFANALRSVLRQDPDVIMVGEVRDAETADIAIQAALTGHLMLSTIHTNDASGAIPRLISLDAKPFLLGPALNAIIGQRLIRKLCTSCKLVAESDTELIERAHRILATLPESSEEKKTISASKALEFFRAEGCDACNHTGYKGRLGIFEVLLVNTDIERLLSKKELSEVDVRTTAASNGMISMAQDGVLKALEKISSLSEVFRVTEDLS